ncbi:hypothetical protein OsI_22832 [Oryza sativa Indica Group]|uniref:Uncharacterized protein n=1 Tax=Oryza sativa subsp. indica TaxID=39946 RepID=B8B1D9_ORYSI|nr:hypothetical protein OsI_22832 [Oryza sativa Indica Group]
MQATTAVRLRRVSSELDDGDKVWEDDEMAAGMEGQQRLLWWRRRWRGDGVGEANLAAPVAEATPKESGCRGDGGTGYHGGRGGQSRLEAIGPVLAFSRAYVLALSEYYILRLRPYIAPYWILPSTYARTIIMFSSAMPANRKSHKQFNEYEDLVLNVPIEVSLPNE